MKALLVLGVFGVLVLPSAAHASPITFIFTGSGSGFLNGQPFGPAAFTITSVGDTSNRSSPASNVFSIPHSSSTIRIDGLGLIAVTTPTRTFVNNSLQLAGHARSLPAGADLFYAPPNVAFGSWDMLSSIGPISGGNGALLQWTANPVVVTDRGQLIFSSAQGIPSTFEAIVPGPASLALLGPAGLVVLRRRHRQS